MGILRWETLSQAAFSVAGALSLFLGVALLCWFVANQAVINCNVLGAQNNRASICGVFFLFLAIALCALPVFCLLAVELVKQSTTSRGAGRGGNERNEGHDRKREQRIFV